MSTNMCAQGFHAPATVGGLCANCDASSRASEKTSLVMTAEGMGKPAWQDISWLDTLNTSKDYQDAYQSSFSETPELNALWSLAAEGRAYEASRARFWELLADESKILDLLKSYRDENGERLADTERQQIAEKLTRAAEAVRAMLHAAGCEALDGTAPRLTMKWDDEKETREYAARTVSIDHAMPQSKDKNKNLTTDPANLRMMFMDVNSVRGARWDANDVLFVPEDPKNPREMSTKERRDKEEFRARVEQMQKDRENK